MRAIPDEFFGALLGAWIGVATQIWTAAWYKTTVFVISFAAFAILLALVAGEYKNSVRWTAAAFLALGATSFGLFFGYFPPFVLFNDQQVVFFYILMAGWVLVSITSTYLAAKLKSPTVCPQTPKSPTVRPQKPKSPTVRPQKPKQ